MTVYKTSKSRFFQYDFVVKGKRYTGSTKVETKRKAETVEKNLRDQIALGVDPDGGMTLDEAAGRLWLEVDRHRKSAKILLHRLKIVTRLLGPGTRLVDLSTRKVSIAIEKRRGETYARGKGKKAKRYVLADATVNSDIVKPLRRLLNRARKTWEIKGIPEIDWKSLFLVEPEVEIRHFSDAYQQAWVDACGPTEQFALELLLTYGWRLNELFFPVDDFKPDTPDGPGLALNKRKKGAAFFPLREPDARRIAARVGVAQAAGFKTIWIERNEKGQLVEVKYAAMQGRIRRAAARAGVDHDRLIHSIRHHVGTDFLNETGDLRMTQKLLAHRDIKSTLRYAHALDSGLRNAIKSRNSPGAESAEAEFIVPDQPRKRR